MKATHFATNMSCVKVRMRVFYVLLVLTFFPVAASGQVFQWAKQIKLTWDPEQSPVTADRSNNLIVVGNSGAQLQLESQTAIILGSGLFVAKFNSSGKLLWQKLLGTTQNVITLMNVKVDRFGSIYFLALVTGRSGTDIGSLHISAQDSTDETVLIKTDSNGVPQWYQICEEHPAMDFYFQDWFSAIFHCDLAIDSSDHVYVGTDYNSDLSVQGNRSLHSQFPTSTALAQFDFNGNLQWRRHVFDETRSVIYNSAYYYGWKHFQISGIQSGCVIGEDFQDSSVVNSVLRLSKEGSTIFSRYSATGDLLWCVKPINGLTRLAGMGVDSAENIYFRSWAFGTLTWGISSTDASAGYEILGKCSSSGSIQRVQRTIRYQGNGIFWNEGTGLLNFSVDQLGNNYLSRLTRSRSIPVLFTRNLQFLFCKLFFRRFICVGTAMSWGSLECRYR
jgi:hypothetical protein